MQAQAQNFKFEIDAEVFEKTNGQGESEYWVGGICSTDHMDQEDERLLQEGLDFAPALAHGYFNDNHDKATGGAVGRPAHAELRNLPDGHKGWYVEGPLFDNPRAIEIRDLANAIERSGDSKRKLGFSVEGAILERDPANPSTVRRAVVREIAITRCFPGDVRVLGAVDKVTRRFYSGAMIEIRLANGQQLSGTPNHPVLTERGWIPLCQLYEGNDRIGCFGSHVVPRARGASSVVGYEPPAAHYVDDVPPTFEEVFDLVRLASAGRWISLAREGQFHGDVVGGDVDVVLADGALRRRFYASFCKQFGENALAASDKELTRLSDTRALLDMCVRYGLTPHARIRSDRELLSLFGRSQSVASELLFSSGSRDAVSFGDVEHSDAADAITGTDRGRVLSASIGFSDLVFKRSRYWHGSVYNLDTAHGWYGANGIVAHNCPVNTHTSLSRLAKSLSAGTAGPQHGCVVTGEGGAAVLAPQSLEGGLYPQTLKKKKKKKMFTKAEAVAHLRSISPQLSDQSATRIVDYAIRHHM